MTKALCTLLLVATLSSVSFAQHSDIEFGYDDVANPTSIEVEQDATSDEGFMFFESDMIEEDPMGAPGNFSTDDPGFETAHLEDLVLGVGDLAWLQFVDASTESAYGAGYVNYVAPGDSVVQALGRISITDNTAATDDLILDGASASGGPTRQFLEVAVDEGDGDGEIHDHVEFDLLDLDPADTDSADVTPFGTYGVMFRIESDRVADGLTYNSEYFWVFFNHGQSDEDFEASLGNFGIVEAVPEPTSGIILTAALGAMLVRRRRS